MLVIVDNLKSDRLEFVWLMISKIRRYKRTSARLPQKADIRLEHKAEFQIGSIVKSFPQRTYMGNPGEWGIPKTEWTAQKAAESSQ
jgi:hypothetical protein